MARISERKYKSGRISYRVSIRRIGLPHYSKTFNTKEEAYQWAKDHEWNYILHPEMYTVKTDPRLKKWRFKG